MKGTNTMKHNYIAFNGYTSELAFTSTTFEACKEYVKYNECFIMVKSLKTGKWCIMNNHRGMNHPTISCWIVSSIMDAKTQGKYHD